MPRGNFQQAARNTSRGRNCYPRPVRKLAILSNNGPSGAAGALHFASFTILATGISNGERAKNSPFEARQVPKGVESPTREKARSNCRANLCVLADSASHAVTQRKFSVEGSRSGEDKALRQSNDCRNSGQGGGDLSCPGAAPLFLEFVPKSYLPGKDQTPMEHART